MKSAAANRRAAPLTDRYAARRESRPAVRSRSTAVPSQSKSSSPVY